MRRIDSTVPHRRAAPAPRAARGRSLLPAVLVVLVVLVVLAGCVAGARRPSADAALQVAGPGCPVPASDTVARAAPPPAPAVVSAAVAGVAAPARRGVLALRLNVPAYRLDLLVDSVVERSYGVAVGMRRYRTPVGAFAVHRIVWNPWWVPPRSPWAKDDTVTPPGPANPMGRVKLLIGGAYYLHGTPFEASIGTAASHGCIRLRNEDAMALARRLQAHAGVGPDAAAILAILADTASVPTDLPQPVPVGIVYEVAEVRGDTLLLHPDVYRRTAGGTRALALLALSAAGRDTLALRRATLAAALRRARTRHVAVLLDSLLASRERTPLAGSP